MHTVFLEGKNVILGPLSKEDNLDDYAQWLNDQEVTLFMESGRFPVSIERIRSYIDKYNNRDDGMLLGIFLKETLKHVGNITLHHIDWRNRHAEIGIFIGDKKARGKGNATQAISLMIEHAFSKLNLRKLYSGVIKGNKASNKVFEKNGFKAEGVLKEHFYLNGEYMDCYKLGLLRREYVKYSNNVST